MGKKGRTIAHRLYLTGMALLFLGGCGAVITTVVVALHDRTVIAEDRLCYETNRPKTVGSARLSEEENNRLFEKCNYSDWGYPHRAWWFADPSTNWIGAFAFSFLAFVPAFLFWAVARWARWVFKPESGAV